MGYAILDKIASAIGGPLKREADVVYVLVETRKFLDFSGNQGYAKLRFYCDWAMHAKLDRRPAQGVVREADAFFQKTLRGTGCSPDENDAFERILNLDEFREELRGFMAEYSIPTLAFDEGNWQSFLSLYARVVEDCPVTCVVPPSPQSLIDTMVIRFAGRSAASIKSEVHTKFFPLDWELYKDGIHKATLRLRPSGELPGATLELTSPL